MYKSYIHPQKPTETSGRTSTRTDPYRRNLTLRICLWLGWDMSLLYLSFSFPSSFLFLPLLLPSSFLFLPLPPFFSFSHFPFPTTSPLRPHSRLYTILIAMIMAWHGMAVLRTEK
ncbi:hypothetical protein BDR22DRAFT_392586 [Usnea florida]